MPAFRHGRVKVRDVVTHESGLLVVPPDGGGGRYGIPADTLADADAMRDVLEGMEPVWEVGTGTGKEGKERKGRKERRRAYSAMMGGFFASELCRRVDEKGRTLGRFWEEEVVDKLGGEEFYIGLTKEQQKRVDGMRSEGKVTQIKSIPPRQFLKSFLQYVLPSPLTSLLFSNNAAHDLLSPFEITSARTIITRLITSAPFRAWIFPALRCIDTRQYGGMYEAVNSPELQKLEFPSGGGLSNARGMARVGREMIARESVLFDDGDGGGDGGGDGDGDGDGDGSKARRGMALYDEGEPMLVDEILALPLRYSTAGFALDRLGLGTEPIGLEGFWG